MRPPFGPKSELTMAHPIDHRFHLIEITASANHGKGQDRGLCVDLREESGASVQRRTGGDHIVYYGEAADALQYE